MGVGGLSEFFLQRIQILIIFFFVGGGGGGARVSDFFFTKNPNLKKKK